MVEVKNAICGPLSKIPSFCNCAVSNNAANIGAIVTCPTVSLPGTGVTIGAQAHFLPCGSAASVGYRAWTNQKSLVDQKWSGQFNTNINLVGFSLGIAGSFDVRAELQGSVAGNKITANVALGACGTYGLPKKTCCNTQCPIPQFKVNNVPIVPLRLLTGTYDFSKFC